MARIETQSPIVAFYTIVAFVQVFRPDIYKLVFRILITKPTLEIQCSVVPLHLQHPSGHLQLVPLTAHPMHNAPAE